MDRAMKRFGKKDKESPHASPEIQPKTEKMKPNAEGAQSEGSEPSDPHADMTGRHIAEMEAMQKRHQQAYSDMHSIHADEMKQMHARHASEIGNGAGAKSSEGPSLPSSKKAAGKGWKSVSKGKSGTEPKGEK